MSIAGLEVSSFTIPTEVPESDGTLEWVSTSLVVVEVSGGGETGLGFSYTDPAAARLIRRELATLVDGMDVMNVPAAWSRMIAQVRNIGRPGIASMAIAAIDSALWDLKARLLDVPLVSLLGAEREDVPVYASGGFTSQSEAELVEWIAGWRQRGVRMLKIKVGRSPAADVRRVRAAARAVGDDAELFTDANGAYDRKQALRFAHEFGALGVTWFEEPVSSDDLEGLRLIRDRAPPGLEIAAGEYGFDLRCFRRMLDAGAVDVLMPDATRCAGITGFLKAGNLCEAFGIPLSAHTAPMLHLHPCCALPAVRHLEYFHDHARVEQLCFDGAIEPIAGRLRPDLGRPGLGLELKRKDAERYRVR